MSRNLSTAEVSRILAMKEARIRELVRAGLCRPVRHGHRYLFSFQDLVVLRVAQSLLARGVPGSRVRRALASLIEELPADRPLSGLRIYADGRQVTVCEGGTSWQPETGQTVLNFDVDELAGMVENIREARTRGGLDAGLPARAEFERALDLEDHDPKEACEAYGRALELDPELVDAYVNLGRIAHEAGDPQRAMRLYRQALERTPDDPIVHFNLALATEDARGAGAALVHYQRALALDENFADAHFNLAGLYEKLGRGADALRHYHACKKLSDS